MRFSVSFLKSQFDIDLPAEQILTQLTQLGLEVDHTSLAAEEFSNVVVGEITAAVPHPDADRLKVCQVSIGENEPLSIVCGAANARTGIKVCVAKVGAVLPGNFKIKKAKLRGVPSMGMLCSEKELGLTESSPGIMELPLDAPIGSDLREYLNLNDVLVEVDLTPNRGDCLSVLGIARELAALNEIAFKHPLKALPDLPYAQNAALVVEEVKAVCPNYFITEMDGVMPQNSPLWLQEQLRRAGFATRNLIVDLTNYIMLLVGQPMHAFDADKIKGAIHVRFARENERLTLLDGKEIALHTDDVVIADDSGAIALAGIMGGLSTSVSESTSRIVLEAAFFEPNYLAGKARRLGLHTDSSHRFERGVDFALASKAMQLALHLYQELANAQIIYSQGVCYKTKTQDFVFQTRLINKILGVEVDSPQIVSILQRLSFTCVEKNEELWVSVPSFRFDIEGSHDLVEEIARFIGYHAIPGTLPHKLCPIASTRFEEVTTQRLKQLLVDRDYHEAITYSFIDMASSKACFDVENALVLCNPLSSEQSIMRQGLLPGLLLALKHNLARQQQRVRLFEVGRLFERTGTTFQELNQLAGVVTGPVQGLQWRDNANVDFFVLKSDVQAVLALFSSQSIGFKSYNKLKYAHPGQCAQIFLADQVVGFIYRLHPQTEKKFGLKKPVYAFELMLDNLKKRTPVQASLISKFPHISRDLALMVPNHVQADNILKAIQEGAGKLFQKVCIFDVYEGEGVEAGYKSLAVNLILQADSTTLTEEEVEKTIENVLSLLQRDYQTTLRGSV